MDELPGDFVTFNWQFEWQFPCGHFHCPALCLNSHSPPCFSTQTFKTNPRKKISAGFRTVAACHCNISPLSAERSGSMLINEPGSECPQEEVAIISIAMLMGISEWRWSQERQSVLITMRERTLWSELALPWLSLGKCIYPTETS